MLYDHDTIVAPATAPGGALAVIRLSGDETLTVCDRIFRGRRPLADAEGYTVHYGRILDGERGDLCAQRGDNIEIHFLIAL